MDVNRTVETIKTTLEPYVVLNDVGSFIEVVSNIYHKHESRVYDSSQLSLRDSAAAWQDALNFLQPYLEPGLRILDFGAGTGFATLQVLNSPIGNLVSEVVCYDLSPEMMNICRGKMERFPNIAFTFLSDADGRQQLEKQMAFDLVITNALLHHLLDVPSFLAYLTRFVRVGGYYVAGHEPNGHFYQNPQLINSTRAFQRYKRVTHRLTLKYWLRKFRIRSAFHDLVDLTNRELIEMKLVERPIPRMLLHKLVDVHVPFGISSEQPWGEIGFNGSRVEEWLGKDFQRIGLYTYSHIKDGLATTDLLWKGRIAKLRRRYPADGADALLIFQRKN